MELETIAWIVGGWFAVSIVVSLALGWFLREVNAAADDAELNQVLSQRRVLRYMRGRKSPVKGTPASQTADTAKSRQGRN